MIASTSQQRSPGRVLALPGQQFPPHSTVSQSQSPGTLQMSPLVNSTTVYAVDSQVITVQFSLTATAYFNYTLQQTAFTGLLNPATRVYSGATSLTNTVTSNVVPLQVVPEVQLLLMTFVASTQQNNTSGGHVLANSPQLTTTAYCSNTSINTMVGPWFPGSTTYTAFSVGGNMGLYNPSTTTTAVGSIVLTVQAILVGINLV